MNRNVRFGTPTSLWEAAVPGHNEWLTIDDDDDKEEDDDDPTIRVFDNVLSATSCKLVHEWAIQHNDDVDDDSLIFYRNNNNNKSIQSQNNSHNDGDRDRSKQLTQLEHVLNDILTQLGDTNEVVEYWCRQDYLDLEVHSDIDELALELEEEEDRILRYQEHGHVLYLQIGIENSDDTYSSCPTCIFPTRRGGWKSSLSTTRDSDDGDDDDDSGNNNNDNTASIPIVTIPAVQGRVVRFKGDLMHAVPKPATRWLLSKDAQRDLSLLEYDDDYEKSDDDKPILRSVVLFNTWKDTGPLDVPEYKDAMIVPASAIPEGIEVDDDGGNDDGRGTKSTAQLEEEQKPLHRAHSEPTNDDIGLVCRKRNIWTQVPIRRMSTVNDATLLSSSSIELQIPLMGNKERRCSSRGYVPLQAPKTFVDALAEPWQPILSDSIPK